MNTIAIAVMPPALSKQLLIDNGYFISDRDSKQFNEYVSNLRVPPSYLASKEGRSFWFYDRALELAYVDGHPGFCFRHNEWEAMRNLINQSKTNIRFAIYEPTKDQHYIGLFDRLDQEGRPFRHTLVATSEWLWFPLTAFGIQQKALV